MDRRRRGGVPPGGRGVAVLRVRAVGRLPRDDRAGRRSRPGLRVRTDLRREEDDGDGHPLGPARRRRSHKVG